MISTYQRLQRRRAAGEIDGFTLIELLIVIVVLGILAAVVIFALGGITGKSQLAACQADGATVSTAMAAFKAQNPQSTPNSTNLVAANTATGGPYIQSWPNATSYKFTIPSGVLNVQSTIGTTAQDLPRPYTGPGTCGAGTTAAPGIGL